jgi:small multidrug resistance family-3 protein
MREHKPLAWVLLGALILAAYRVVAALQPISEFGRVYAAYGGIFIALSLAWGIVVDRFRPDRWDLLGAPICVAGVVVILAPLAARPRLGPKCLERLSEKCRSRMRPRSVGGIMRARAR